MSMHKGILGQSTGGASVKKECCGNPLRGCMDCPPRNDVVLGDYIARKQRDEAFDAVAKEHKLTFAEWYWDGPFGDTIENSKDKEYFALKVWRAAQENK